MRKILLDEGAEAFGHLGCLRLVRALSAAIRNKPSTSFSCHASKVLCTMETSRMFCSLEELIFAERYYT
jgi:hypothetical protein